MIVPVILLLVATHASAFFGLEYVEVKLNTTPHFEAAITIIPHTNSLLLWHCQREV